jgi:hypothetical protein
MIEVEAPDGTIVEFDDNTPADAIKSAMQKKYGTRKPYEGYGDYALDLGRTALQGATLGFGDEAVAGIRSIVSDESYDDALKSERDAVDRFRHHNPGTALATELAAGFAAPGGLAARAALKGKSLLSQTARSGGVGAGYGGVAGFGAGEGGFKKRIENAGTGVQYGLAFGTALPSVVSGARNAANTVSSAVRPRIAQATKGPEEAADILLARRMKRSGHTPARVMNDLKEGDRVSRLNSNSQAVLPEMLADTSDDLQRLAGTVYRQGGKGGEIIKDAIETRQRGTGNNFTLRKPTEQKSGQIETVLDAFDRALAIKTSGTARVTERALLNTQKKRGQDLYTKARSNSEEFDLSPVLNDLTKQADLYPGAFGARLRRAAGLFVRRDGNKAPISDITRFDNSKKALDDFIEAAGRQGNGNLKRELTQFKDRLLQRVHKYDGDGNPTRNKFYQQARDEWGSAAENREAIDLGRAALRESSEVSVEQFRELNPAQQKLFRIGLRESLRNALATKRPGNDVTQLFQQRRVRELLTEAIPRPRAKSAVFRDRPERFGNYLERHQRFVQTRNKTLGGSPTQGRQLDDARHAADMLASAVNMARGGANVVLEAIVAAGQRALGFSDKVSEQLARRLTTTDRAEQIRILQRVRNQMSFEEFEQFTRAIAQRLDASAASVGIQSGLAAGDNQ